MDHRLKNHRWCTSCCKNLIFYLGHFEILPWQHDDFMHVRKINVFINTCSILNLYYSSVARYYNISNWNSWDSEKNGYVRFIWKATMSEESGCSVEWLSFCTIWSGVGALQYQMNKAGTYMHLVRGNEQKKWGGVSLDDKKRKML